MQVWRYRDHDLVFATSLGEPIPPWSHRKKWEKIVRAAGLEGLRFHDLRHGHAGLMLAAGVHPKIASERLGHSSIATTMDTYSHLLPGLGAQAARDVENLIEGRAAQGPS